MSEQIRGHSGCSEVVEYPHHHDEAYHHLDDRHELWKSEWDYVWYYERYDELDALHPDQKPY